MIDFYYWPTPNGWKISIMLEECRLARREIYGRQAVASVERVPSARPALGSDGHRGRTQGVEIAVDGAYRDVEPLGERLRRNPRAAPAQVLGQGEESLGTSHRGYLT